MLFVFELADTLSPYLLALLALTLLLIGFVAGSTTQLFLDHQENYDGYQPKHLKKRRLLGLTS